MDITIKDNVTGNQLPVSIEVYDGHILVKPKGYGDKVSENGCGSPIMIEHYNGNLRVIVWANINEEDPTHIILMDGAKESKRE